MLAARNLLRHEKISLLTFFVLLAVPHFSSVGVPTNFSFFLVLLRKCVSNYPFVFCLHLSPW